tara:strand:- start:21 stop:200 length:180 start_codon:yes stop_codon:yes gene_type:complete
MEILFWIIVICLPLITINQLLSFYFKLNKLDEWQKHKQILEQNNLIISYLSNIDKKLIK